MSAKALAEKDKGNDAFKAGDYPRAIGHYTAAFIADPFNPVYPLNRAAAYLKLGKNEDAERDCDSAIHIDGKNVKGLFRRGQARVALQKLRYAEADFAQVLRLDPANQAAKNELAKVQDALKAIPVTSKQRSQIDISTLPQTSSATPRATPLKRRRIPIRVIEPPSAPPTTSSGSEERASLLTPVSSRPLSQPTSSPHPPVPISSPPQRGATSSTEPSTQPPRPSQPFREAKTTREELQPRGGIFRADGTQKLFMRPSAPSDGQNGSSGVPKREPPQTLVAFTSLWNSLTTEEERWEVLRQIPPARLPVLFKMSLDARILAAILHSLRIALVAAPKDPELLKVARAYMVNIPRIPRFGTVSLMMSGPERSDAQAIWDILGRFQSDGGVEGQMEKRKEEGSKSAWGCR
ncbi:hypothetical protein C8Q79DRAFT_1095705 [Trametes meyenii]|nr:hypothetical protein C8Q79DRAFT_1095705 [Trametes meyenii]